MGDRVSGRCQVLALDGGGLKGLFSAAVLAAVEEDLSVVLADHFDLIAGTSTGGLVALGLGAGLRPQEIVDFYVEKGPHIFGARRGVLGRVRHARHRPGRLREAIDEVFGDLLARLEGQDVPAEDVELAAAYLAGEIDSATYEQRLLDLVTRHGESQPRSA